MIETVAVLLLLAISMAMATLGAVLLVRFIIPGAGRRARILSAAVLGPGLVMLPTPLFTLDGPNEWLPFLLGFMAVLIGVCAVIGWPISHIATRKLDRLTHFDVGTFE
ncbi:hypothetical protein ACI5KX_07655 [Erythrobacter sp. GH1-10]|uniref:hypothetical protein n=1 Tax=Erythrobacter sp. GH1-10 TaxID=3349334 RepID=UPI003877B383